MNTAKWNLEQRPDGLWFMDYEDGDTHRYNSLLVTPAALIELKDTLETWSRHELARKPTTGPITISTTQELIDATTPPEYDGKPSP